MASAPGGEFRVGDTVATALGGLGMQFDGRCAEYTLVPATEENKGGGKIVILTPGVVSQ